VQRLGLILSLLIVLGAAWITYDAVVEAFGSGPPYYGRTTNLDKWASPIPWLIVIDGLALALAAAILWFTRTRSRRA
jgi:hypothetical protein